MLSWPIRRHAEGPFENMWRAMATDCKISSPLSPNCGVPLELPVAVWSKPIDQLARYIARVLPARGRGLAHEIKYDGFHSARGSGYLACASGSIHHSTIIVTAACSLCATHVATRSGLAT